MHQFRYRQLRGFRVLVILAVLQQNRQSLRTCKVLVYSSREIKSACRHTYLHTFTHTCISIKHDQMSPKGVSGRRDKRDMALRLQSKSAVISRLLLAILLAHRQLSLHCNYSGAVGQRMYAALLAAEVCCQGVLAVIASEDGGNERLVSLLALNSFCLLNYSHSLLLTAGAMGRLFYLCHTITPQCSFSEINKRDGNLLLFQDVVNTSWKVWGGVRFVW